MSNLCQTGESVDQFSEPEDRFSLLSREHVGVLLLSDRFGDMAQTTRHHIGWFTRFQPRSRLGVSEAVIADTSKFNLLDDSIETLGYDIGVKWRTIRACRYEIRFLPRWTRFESFGDLLLPTPSEMADREWVHIDGTATAVGLRGGRFDPPSSPRTRDCTTARVPPRRSASIHRRPRISPRLMPVMAATRQRDARRPSAVSRMNVPSYSAVQARASPRSSGAVYAPSAGFRASRPSSTVSCNAL